MRTPLLLQAIVFNLSIAIVIKIQKLCFNIVLSNDKDLREKKKHAIYIYENCSGTLNLIQSSRQLSSFSS